VLTELGTISEPYKKQIVEMIVETVENEGFFYGDFEMGITETGFKLRFSRAPKKTVKTFVKVKGEK
jgi:hypothetical protein